MTNFDITSILPLLMGGSNNMGGGCGMDSNAMLIKLLMDATKRSPADKYFNPNGGPCPPPNNNQMIELLLKTLMPPPCQAPPTQCCNIPQKPQEKPCGFNPIQNWCGNEMLYILAMMIKRN